MSGKDHIGPLRDFLQAPPRGDNVRETPQDGEGKMFARWLEVIIGKDRIPGDDVHATFGIHGYGLMSWRVPWRGKDRNARQDLVFPIQGLKGNPHKRCPFAELMVLVGFVVRWYGVQGEFILPGTDHKTCRWVKMISSISAGSTPKARNLS
jgi:hypothetical protein